MMRALAQDNLFSGTVAVSQEGPDVGALAFYEGYGLASFELNAPMQRHYSNFIGSNTKFMTAVAIFQLHQRGLVHVDEPVSKYMAAADFGKPQGWLWCPRVYNQSTGGCQTPTLRQLLTMGSGIIQFHNCEYDPSDWQWRFCLNKQPGGLALGNDVLATQQAQVPIRQVLAKFIDVPLEFAPGTSYSYSNANFIFASYVIEKVTGLPFAEYLSLYLWRPSGMGVGTSTYLADAEGVYGVKQGTVSVPAYQQLFAPFGALVDQGQVLDPRLAVGLGNVRLPAKQPAGTFLGVVRTPWFHGEAAQVWGAGAAVSNGQDMVRWFRTFITAPERLGLNQTTLKDMLGQWNPHQSWTSQVSDGTCPRNITAYYGPGIVLVPGPDGLHNVTRFSYDGSIAGMNCVVYVRLRPKADKSTVVVLSTNTNAAIPSPNLPGQPCMVQDPLNPNDPPQQLPQRLCEIASAGSVYTWASRQLERIWNLVL